MEIKIQNWWNAKVWSNEDLILNPEEILKISGKIAICTIVIDGNVVGCVEWDGNDLNISKVLVKKDAHYRGKTQ